MSRGIHESVHEWTVPKRRPDEKVLDFIRRILEENGYEVPADPNRMPDEPGSQG